jgi:hypothetical protein
MPLLPPFSKAANPNSNGYDPDDCFDLGDLDQKGSVKTVYGNGEELRRLIATIHDNGMGAIADKDHLAAKPAIRASTACGGVARTCLGVWQLRAHGSEIL